MYQHPGPGAAPAAFLIPSLAPLLAAEAAAAVPEGDAADLRQSVWLRLLELPAAPADPAAWLRVAVRTEARLARRRIRREFPCAAPPDAPAAGLSTAERVALHDAVARLPGCCPVLMGALLRGDRPGYRAIAAELGMSQGSLGPLRSRCLAVLRRMYGVRP
ncbi:sigma-70 family RNA polymerase sigma factor [Streptomyces sp. A7024]|uniref:Sigma-70 family RNA polymerase sigma factor n=1 Tax=Streptomyces coryli TaxID=1128680 RepID=A0A6G4U030_9ACTN|nr:sigma-70 family RNA polymerase sigma factor [Streptomyces coryli]NGN65585.1 sigma-70 family RNA polymerase sigma factor [Streptomyces coryli]